jgi:hypothetical protein
MTGHDAFPGSGVRPSRTGSASVHVQFLGRRTRSGSWEDLAQGTFKEAVRAVREDRFEGAAELVSISLLEAQELREVYEKWPKEILEWIRSQGGSDRKIAREHERLSTLIGDRAMNGIEAAWPAYLSAAQAAIEACASRSSAAREQIEHTRSTWMQMHDEAVDRVSGLIDVAVRVLGEGRLGDLWDHLLADWYEIHARRYSLENQDWEVSAHQLMVSIVDGMHAHLVGTARQGDIELVHERDRVGFRFAPCGSGGRALDPAITAGRPRSGPPFNFAVTTEEHDWAWNKKGICSYCVHCCLLNEVMPIDRLGYPTRVIDPPVWGDGSQDQRSDPTCTWWVYRHPSLVPDQVYRRVGRSPERRPKRLTARESKPPHA